MAMMILRVNSPFSRSAVLQGSGQIYSLSRRQVQRPRTCQLLFPIRIRWSPYNVTRLNYSTQARTSITAGIRKKPAASDSGPLTEDEIDERVKAVIRDPDGVKEFYNELRKAMEKGMCADCKNEVISERYQETFREAPKLFAWGNYEGRDFRGKLQALADYVFHPLTVWKNYYRLSGLFWFFVPPAMIIKFFEQLGV
ncbi:hypothetical protein BJ508DRAFT_334355 [Ascobolus immersus RN42]|uniref:Uncharacterized protein n=1 Tax=Ascobolus immersus RN42 TaxID=1160509 RepID=A0A3N4HGB6_ASCIM|nr:hypothetical protein BJ508DRAFT_334355 [Ascobolus immersus RN42]